MGVGALMAIVGFMLLRSWDQRPRVEVSPKSTQQGLGVSKDWGFHRNAQTCSVKIKEDQKPKSSEKYIKTMLGGLTSSSFFFLHFYFSTQNAQTFTWSTAVIRGCFSYPTFPHRLKHLRIYCSCLILSHTGSQVWTVLMRVAAHCSPPWPRGSKTLS